MLGFHFEENQVHLHCDKILCMIKELFYFFLLIPVFGFSQNDSIIKGKVVSESSMLEGIYIINLSKKNSVVTNERGYFQISANISDTLQFSAVNLKAKKYVLTVNDFSKDLVFVKMESLITELDEVAIIQYKNINAVALGIVPANQKTYTPAERKVRTATTGLLDPLINLASGRTKTLKKQVEIEKKEILQDKITDYYNTDYIVNTLKIPKEYVDGFLFYVVENEKFVSAMNAKNKTMATFVLSELGAEYRTLKLLDKENTKETTTNEK